MAVLEQRIDELNGRILIEEVLGDCVEDEFTALYENIKVDKSFLVTFLQKK